LDDVLSGVKGLFDPHRVVMSGFSKITGENRLVAHGEPCLGLSPVAKLDHLTFMKRRELSKRHPHQRDGRLKADVRAHNLIAEAIVPVGSLCTLLAIVFCFRVANFQQKSLRHPGSEKTTVLFPANGKSD